MKIAHLTSVHHARDTRILYKECTSLAEAGYEVFLVAYGESFDENGVKVIGLGDKPKNRFLRIFKGAKQVVDKGLTLNCQVYHLHDPELLPYIPRLKRAGKKVIFDSHEDVPKQILEKDWLPARRLVSVVYSWLENYYLGKADAVICVTPHLVERLATINPNCVMVTNYPILEEVSAISTHHNQGNYLCFAGRISGDWNHEAIVKALQEIEGVSYVLCGKADSIEYVEKLKHIDRKGILDYRGIISHDQVKNLYSNALAGVSWLCPSPNIGGNLGTLGNNKLFEQMSAGIPVIISDLKFWTDIIHKYDCGFVVSSGDIPGFRDAVQHLRDNRGQARVMGKNGHRAVEEEYNWAKQSTVLTGLYHVLMQEESFESICHI